MPVVTRATGSTRRDPNACSITFRLSVELRSALSEYAAAERRSLNGVLALLLEEAIAARRAAAAAEAAEMAELRRAARAAKAAGLIETTRTRKRKPKATAA